jgi:CHAD domain-containing protein
MSFCDVGILGEYQPASYSSKYSGNFQPKLAAQLAVFRILADLFQIAKQNQWGVIADVDSEFLHDYRTAIRRMRSIAAECQEVLPQDIVVRLKTDFRTLGKATNRLRDFDVFLQRQAEYQAAVPAILGSGLDQLFDAMRKKRQKTCDQLQAFLRDPSYERMVDDWDRFFTLQSHISSAPASPTVLELARKTIANRFTAFSSREQRFRSDAEGQVHALRIECKKLRLSMKSLLLFFHGKRRSLRHIC